MTDIAHVKAAAAAQGRDFYAGLGVRFTDKNGEAFCPFHNDEESKQPSFSVYEGDDGHLRWKCHGKCNAGGDAIDFFKKSRGFGDMGEALQALEEHLNGPAPKLAPKANGKKKKDRRPRDARQTVYHYHDADGQLQWQGTHNSPENAADRPEKSPSMHGGTFM